MSVTAAVLATLPLMVTSTIGAQAGAYAMRKGRLVDTYTMARLRQRAQPPA
jgi:hypothetical protein